MHCNLATLPPTGEIVDIHRGRQRWPCHSSLLAGRRVVYRSERVLEHVIRDAPSLFNPLGLVERPVDTEVDAALAVFVLGLGERRKMTQDEWTYVTVVVECHVVELV
jgi:hypothetical protein